MPEEQEGVVAESAQADNLDTTQEQFNEEPSGDLYDVKVDGESTQVSLNELQDGYQRQSDYTRKTQELASERSRLQQAEAIVVALEKDPSGTLQALARSFDIPLDNKVDSSDESWDSEDLDPMAQKVAALEARLEDQDRINRQTAIQKEVSQLQESYGDFDSQELLSHALKHQINNLEAALTHMRYNSVASEADKLRGELSVFEKKREAAVVESGGSKQVGSFPESSDKPKTLRDAFAMALKQHQST